VSEADKHHLHHQLMKMGLTHRQSVLAIYALSLVFSFISLLFLLSPVWGMWLLIAGLVLALELFVESIGLLGEKYKPLLQLTQKIINSRSKKDPTVEVWHLGQDKPDQLKSKNKPGADK
ncbi:undecaprenyl/decaprenyl-phosphate alpha-N-acetylglucosaminyl 1-phosphate transferase, partial [Lactobacillus sp. XV13L]|nr:undecaprenyl/decaprenyl-phosphate alpha-N-acetylglucosaminyl 1-phosphate transferase [Lactobacillus sp. XV13L]